MLVAVLLPWHISAQQARNFPLESRAGVRMQNVVAEPATLDGKKGVRVTFAAAMTPDQQVQIEPLAVIEGVEFTSGTIEAEIAGTPAPGTAGGGARGFVGIAFRLQPDGKTYDAFYLRPTNGRADDQERRNHSAQYISHPDWTWSRLRHQQS
jgi:hypothetical protein